MFKSTEDGIIVEGEPWEITLEDHAEILKIFVDADHYNREEKIDGVWRHMSEDKHAKRLL